MRLEGMKEGKMPRTGHTIIWHLWARSRWAPVGTCGVGAGARGKVDFHCLTTRQRHAL